MPAETQPGAEQSVARLERRLSRARSQIAILEQMIEEKTRTLFLAQEELRVKSRFLESVLAGMPNAVIVADEDDRITAVEGATAELTGRTGAELVGEDLAVLLQLGPGGSEPAGQSVDAALVSHDAALPVLVSWAPIDDDAGAAGRVYVATDVSRQRRMEVELRHSQKLESIGQLAAGIAHEINTPVQFVGDTVEFLGEALTDLLELTDHYGSARESLVAGGGHQALVDQLIEHEEVADLAFLREEVPRSIERTRDGLRRVADIVHAMKQFAHPGGPALSAVDLNEVIGNTLIVARNEYKYVADVDLDLGEIPHVTCDRGDLTQVLLNLVVNAAHAIEDTRPGERGHIRIATSQRADGVEIRIGDDGGGVPDEIRERIFDPFFTTKEPGRGTGQGLAIAHALVVERYGGTIDLDVEAGVGSTFRLWLPTDGHVR